MALNIENIVAELENATILELSELVKAIEEKFDVTAAAPVAVAAAADAGAADAPYLYRHLCPAVTTRKLRVYFFHCPDRAASAPSPSDPLADIRLSGRQEGARGKAGKGKAEGRPVGHPSAGNRPDPPEAVSQAAENSRPAGLPGDFPDMPGHPRRHEGFPGATGCLAAAPAGPGGDGDGHVLLHPPADVLDELLGDFPGAAGLSCARPATLYRLQRQHRGERGICLYPASAGRLPCWEKIHMHPGAVQQKDKGRLWISP